MATKFPKILYGGDYSPEQWPESTWDADLEWFEAAGINVATINVFAWSVDQPEESVYDFGWLDRIMDKLAERKMYACLATGTAAVPPWMAKKYPDVLSVGFDGLPRGYGMRHNFCPNSPNYRRLSRALAKALAERYRNHPALLLWHINNEYISLCYCDRCAQGFRDWLKARYGSLERLNAAWNTTFWSHTFTDWDEIVVPNLRTEHWTEDKTAFPSMSLDYRRFNSESVRACYLEEYRVLKQVTPHIPATTNFHGVGTYKPLNYFDWADVMDVVAWDNYPAIDTPVSQIAFRHDLMRGMRHGQSYLIMEQTPSQQNWQPYNALKRPGVMRLLSYQALARGADGVLFFQLKRSRGGSEKFHGAVLDHEGHGYTRVFRECQALGRELTELGDRFLGGRVPARAGILFDWENWWAIDYSSGPTELLDYVQQVQKVYDAFFARHIPVDILRLDSDLAGYDVVVAPVLYMLRAEFAEKVRAFVARGGIFLTTFLAGVADEHDLVTTGGYPGLWRELLGIWVEEWDALMPDQANSIEVLAGDYALSGSYRCDMLCEIVHLEGAEAIGTYGHDFYQGVPALTRHRVGQGEAWYLAANAEPRLLSDLVETFVRSAGLRPLLAEPNAHVEVTQRQKGGDVFTFYLNHGDEVETIALGSSAVVDLLTGEQFAQTMDLAAKGVRICRSVNPQ